MLPLGGNAVREHQPPHPRATVSLSAIKTLHGDTEVVGQSLNSSRRDEREARISIAGRSSHASARSRLRADRLTHHHPVSTPQPNCQHDVASRDKPSSLPCQ